MSGYAHEVCRDGYGVWQGIFQVSHVEVGVLGKGVGKDKR